MEDMFGRFFPAWSEERGQAWMPAVDMIDEKDEILVKADLPGLDQKDIEVTVEDGTLTIRGERKAEKEEKKEGYYYAERSSGAFVRSLALPTGVEAEKVKATFKQGVLEVHLPKAKEAKGKTIEIKAE
jgi:HSP20 family protein